MLCLGWMDDRRGLRPRLLFKTTPGGKGAGTGKRNWMLWSGGMADGRGLRPRLMFKTTPGGKEAGTGTSCVLVGWLLSKREGSRLREQALDAVFLWDG
jgi:hypothetical protein